MVMRINRSKKLKIAILLTLLIIIAANSFVSDFSSSNLFVDEIDESIDSLKNNDLSSLDRNITILFRYTDDR